MTLNQVQDKMFPNTPIEVQKEIVREIPYWHVYLEGDWHSKFESPEGAAGQVRYLCRIHGDDWWYRRTRANPSWHGWGQIQRSDLVAFCD